MIDPIPTPTGRCTCGRDACLRLVDVQHVRTGRPARFAFSEIGTVKTEDRRTVWESAKIQGEWRFVRWHERCSTCSKDAEPEQQEAFAA